MNRLTKDLHTPHDDTTYAEVVKDAIDRENIVLTKLKHYEDIEEELGIDLITLFKALKDGFYFKYKDKILSSNEYSVQIRTNIRGNWVFVFDGDNLTLFTIKIKDYGNTWWLSETKEE